MFEKIRKTELFWQHILLDSHRAIIQHYAQNKPEKRIFYHWIKSDKTKVMLHMPIRDILELHFLSKHFQFVIVINYEAKIIVLTNRKRDINAKILNIEKQKNPKISILENHVDFIVGENIDIFSKTDAYAKLFQMNFMNS
jgi:hypothetical protein